ncbi:hypothetical protein [uncultured Psychroserpens sp.]|uniref:hypothetical protein n=1 Tax=uncultured Psychroserpens sp. TaxID=255436 RepID=UPI0026369732|nr:hypothetical protein [uncultured Psychroserpens sp.]
MRSLKQISFLILMLVIMTSFSRCMPSQYQLQKESSINFDEAYSQKWTSGIKDGGSGVDVFITVNDSSIQLDSMYFREQRVKLNLIEGNKRLYVGRFKIIGNQQHDIILSSDSKEEHDNTMPKKRQEIPFDLQDNECVISYIKANKTYYYKILNIEMRQPLNYPSAPKN